MTISSNEQQPTQAFQSCSTGGVIRIPTMIDPRTRQPIVYWDDIQDMFENAKSVKNGETLVPFMRDDDHKRIMPLRIVYHPGVVLEVVEGAHGQANTSREASTLSDDTISSKESREHNYGSSSELAYGCTMDTELLARDVAAVSVAYTNTDNDALVKYTGGAPAESQSSLRAYNQSYNSYIEAIISGQAMQAASIKQSMDVHFDRLQVEMDKNKALQEQLVSMQKEMQQLQHQTREEQQQARDQLLEKQQQVHQLQKSMDEKQDRIIQMQQQALNRLAIIQNRLQALLIQNYELHEYPIPRLFIVLPKATGTRDKLTKPFSEQFRLYFLCECGTHTMPDDCKTPHEIHLAKHEGYDLEKPNKFFEQYRTYLLAMMYMIKYGIVAAGLIVPPLANFKIADELIEGQKHVEYLKKNIAPLVNDTINYLQDIKRNTEAGSELSADHAEIDKLEALEGADLRQLESYLNVKDRGRVLGNLFRIVTPEGHVKWVCFDHYRANYQEVAMQRLRDIIQVNDGNFIEEIGRIEIKIATSILARQFYDALIKARGIQELEITLEWDATMDELRAFAKAVTTANVIRLTIDGTQLKGPAIDIVNRSRRFDPIVQLASNARIQSLHLKGFDAFFSRVSNPTLTPASKFRTLSLDSTISSKDKVIKSFNGLLGHFSTTLTILELKFRDQYPITKATGDILSRLRKLESLKIDHGNFSFASSVSESKIQDIVMITKRLSDLGMDDINFIREGGLISLGIEYTPQEADQDKLVDILRHNSKLNILRIGCQEARCLAIVNLVVSTRATLLQEGGSCQLRAFILMEEKLVRFNTWGSFDDNTHIPSYLLFSDDSPIFDMHTSIQPQCKTLITEQDPVCDFVQEYGWSIVALMVSWSFTDCFATILDDITSKRGSRLEVLLANPFNLTDSGLNHLDKIVERSPNLHSLTLYLTDLQMAGHVEKTQLVLSRYREVLSGMVFHGDSPEKWLPQIASSFPTRNNFPRLARFAIEGYSQSIIPSYCLPWIVAMVSSSSQEFDSMPMDTVVGQESPGVSEASVPVVALQHVIELGLCNVALDSEGWRKMIEAIDFCIVEDVSFWESNFGEEQFKLLVDRIPENATEMAPLKGLYIRGTDVVKNTDPRVLETMLATIRMKVPSIEINTE